MKTPTSMPRPKGFRCPREIIAYTVWAYHRFALSTADAEDLLAEHGVIASREAIQLSVNRFGAHFTVYIRCDRPRPNDKWHLDEVVIPINAALGQPSNPNEFTVHFIEQATIAPRIELAPDGGNWRKVVGQHAPLATGRSDVKDCAKYVVQACHAGRPIVLRGVIEPRCMADCRCVRRHQLYRHPSTLPADHGLQDSVNCHGN